MPTAIGKLIANLGLRYRPTATTDLDAHAEALRLLAIDVADLPPDYLARAITSWVRTERWMPRAADLVALCQRFQRQEIEGRAGGGRPALDEAEAFCQSRNAELQSGRHPRGRTAADLEWFVGGGAQPQLRYRRKAPSLRLPVPREEIGRLNRALRKYDAPFRYDRDGYDFDLVPGMPDPTVLTDAAT